MDHPPGEVGYCAPAVGFIIAPLMEDVNVVVEEP